MVALTSSVRWKPFEQNLRFSREEGIVPPDYKLEILSVYPTGPPYQWVSWFCFSGETLTESFIKGSDLVSNIKVCISYIHISCIHKGLKSWSWTWGGSCPDRKYKLDNPAHLPTSGHNPYQRDKWTFFPSFWFWQVILYLTILFSQPSRIWFNFTECWSLFWLSMYNYFLWFFGKMEKTESIISL